MLPPALLAAADRLVTPLMALVEAITPIAIAGGTPALPADAAYPLALRIARLILTLIRISNFGTRAPAVPNTPASRDPAPTLAPRAPPTLTIPRTPGWLLAALPDIAPAIADHLRTLLDDPAVAALLVAAPTLHRTLRPLLRGLDCIAEPPPSPAPPPPRTPTPKPSPAARPSRITRTRHPPATPARAIKTTSAHPLLLTSISLRFRNI